MKSQKVRFMPPPNSTPEGIGVDEEFDVTDTWKMEKDGHACLVKFGDTDMDYGKGNGKEDRPGYDKYRKSMGPQDEGMMEQGGAGMAAK